MRSIITNPIRKVEYDRNHKVTIIYRNSLTFWFYDICEDCIIVGEYINTNNGRVEGRGALPLKHHRDLKVYKSCFITHNDRGGLIYC